MFPPVLIINSYGGSLTLAAVQEGHPILHSMEDHNFGLDSQRINFPDLSYKPEMADWPLDEGLHGSIVIAHPPCAGFSSQNSSKRPEAKGLESHAFACTTKILEHVMPRRPEAIAIESVCPALKGADAVHRFYADAWDYDLYRVIQNAASFGVPQWRRRFWAIFVKKQPGRQRQFTFQLAHKVKYLSDVLPFEAEETGLSPTHTKLWQRQVGMLAPLGYSEAAFREMLKDPGSYGNLIHILARRHEVKKGDTWPPWGSLHDNIVGGTFLSGALHVLDPNSFAPTLLGYAWWYYGNRVMGYDDLKEIMGFPRNYQYHNPRITATLLSKGVCPPVARWILREIRANVFGMHRPTHDVDLLDENAFTEVTVQPEEVAYIETPDHLKHRPKEATA
jgi:site-specific DNA-cytosine methylase